MEDIAREEVPRARRDKDVGEEPFTTDTSAVTHTGVTLRVQGVEQSAVHQVGGPDWCKLINGFIPEGETRTTYS